MKTAAIHKRAGKVAFIQAERWIYKTLAGFRFPGALVRLSTWYTQLTTIDDGSH
jgi:hypothetical protein